jgi:ABC-type transport system involved in multi-copper enzyme maturation permease subunit
MIWLTAKKDFLLNLLSIRFFIGFALCLVIIPFTMIVNVDSYQNQMRIYQIDHDKAEQELKECKVYSRLRPTAVKKPEILSVFSKGISGNIGNQQKVTLEEYPLFPSGHASSRDNPLLNAFFSIDFSTVIAIVLSLIAFVFAYDAITREREEGTMKLVFTGQISRISFLFGKLLGLLITLLPILVFCYLLACLIVLANPEVHFTATDWGGIIFLFLTSIVYMILFIVLGMLISSLTSHSSSAIILSLLCWIGFLFLIPNIAVYLSKSFSRTPLYDNVQTAMNGYQDEYIRGYMDEWKKLMAEMGLEGISHWTYSGGYDDAQEMWGGSREVSEFHKALNTWAEPTRIAYADKKWAIQKDYLDKLVKQQRLQHYLSWLSPSEMFKQAANSLCRTDADAFLKYMDSQRAYRETMIRFFVDNRLFSSYRYFTAQKEEDHMTEEELEANPDVRTRGSMDDIEKPIDTDNVPRYVYRQSGSMETFKAALDKIAALLAVCMALLIATIAVFMKYDVR